MGPESSYGLLLQQQVPFLLLFSVSNLENLHSNFRNKFPSSSVKAADPAKLQKIFDKYAKGPRWLSVIKENLLVCFFGVGSSDEDVLFDDDETDHVGLIWMFLYVLFVT